MKIILLGATFSTNNLGVNVLTAGTIKCILHQFPDAEIALLDYGKERVTYDFEIHSRTIPIQLLNMRFSKKFYLRNNIIVLILLSFLLKLIPFEKVKKKLISKNFYLFHISQADIAASLAGGDSFSDIYGLGRFFYISLPQLLVLFLGKKLVLLPQTIGPFKGRMAKGIARFILGRAVIVYSRDYTGLKETKDFLKLHRNSEKLKFCYDVGFVLDPARPYKIDLDGFPEHKTGGHSVIGLNVSGLLFMGGYTQDNMFGLKIDYREFIYELIDFLIQKKNIIVMLVPHVFGSGEHSESDLIACEKIYGTLKKEYRDKIYIARGIYNQSQIKYIIGLCDFFIGSRMHACIAALSQGIPAVSIAYSKKFYGVMQSIGVEALVADPRKLEKEEIFNIIDKAYEQRDSIREQLTQTMPQVKEKVLGLFRHILSSA